MIVVKCPNPGCSAAFRVDTAHVGKRARCKKCGTRFVIEPSLSRAPAAEPPAEVSGPAAGGPEPWQTGKVLLDEYEVERLLGRGGMGVVYLVRSRRTGGRFAAKQILAEHLRNEERRRSFLRELQTWIDLPEHPNLAACRFFRTVEGQIVIFAEYVAGGSLHEWIRDGRLYGGGPEKALERILDVAIQFAWGLHVAHEHGLVHQDVKPQNLLMAADGTFKVTDFGLARALAAAQTGEAEGAAYAGMTPEYSSPQQARREPLTHRTDIWSWGLSVLEMFAGGTFWRHGRTAAESLRSYLQAGPQSAETPPMPQGVARMLEKCFREDPAERWATMSDAADALIAVYGSAIPRPYARSRPAAAPRGAPQPGDYRWAMTGGSWEDPREWLQRALVLDGRDPSEASRLLQTGADSRQAQVVGDLAAYEEAHGILTRLVAKGREDLQVDLVDLCHKKAVVHLSSDDLPGSIAMLDQAIRICERLLHQQGRGELRAGLARCYVDKGIALSRLKDDRQALAVYDRAADMLEHLVDQEHESDLGLELALCYANRAASQHALQDHQNAADTYGRAIEILQRFEHLQGESWVSEQLALCRMSKGGVLIELGDDLGAAGLLDRAIPAYEALAREAGDFQQVYNLGTCYMNRGLAAFSLGERSDGLALLDRAIETYHSLVYEKGRSDAADRLALCYMNRALASIASGDHQGAVVSYDRAIGILERLVLQEGRWDQATSLGTCYSVKGAALYSLGDATGAAELYDRAIDIWEQVVDREGHGELAEKLGACYFDRGEISRLSGDLRNALSLCDRAAALLEPAVYQDGRAICADALARGYRCKGLCREGLGDLAEAMAMYERSRDLLQWLVHEVGRADSTGDLACSRLFWADVAAKLGRTAEARGEARQAYPVLEYEVQRTGRADLAETLEWARRELAPLLRG